ncbi:helix-turn-helix transcriptional regulator [Campylobacter sp. RM12637]|uniref:helix-turn-helix transcriptional regulator n=1 Tax=Campylobacter sp. RM12637 TaxID=2735734 RepID=UPI00301449F9|nr:helix-turn-helix transcriptional regulator [Campylobacter sp. RM12637]
MITKYDNEINKALEKLGKKFSKLNWNFSPNEKYKNNELVSHWPGENDEDIMICVFKGKILNEVFHRHDFIFLHFALKGDYESYSNQYKDSIKICEGDCYIGQPYNGYAARKNSKNEGIIIGILIKQDIFIQEFLPSFLLDIAMLNFFLEPNKNKFSDEYVHLSIPKNSIIWRLLGIIILEYSNKSINTQKIIKPLVMSICMYISAEYKNQNLPVKLTLVDKIIEYINLNSNNVTLLDIASLFGYHPIYISKLLPKKIGKTFSQILLESRMQKAKLLIDNTDLSIEKIANMIGYSNNSNFYKAYKKHFKTSPRKMVKC